MEAGEEGEEEVSVEIEDVWKMKGTNRLSVIYQTINQTARDLP
jgi:hypothetical protein